MADGDASAQPLLTEKSLALALSPPRAPPVGTAHRTLLLASSSSRDDPSTQPVALHYHQNNVGCSHRIRTHLQNHLIRAHEEDRNNNSTNNNNNNSRRRRQLPHPHLPAHLDWHTQITRGLSVLLPTSWHNAWRDSGTFRTAVDRLVTLSAPTMGLSHPTAVLEFGRLSRRCRRHQYGPHARQIMEVFVPPPPVVSSSVSSDHTATTTSVGGHHPLLFFVHGGAWGSGVPWWYRLVAAPFMGHHHNTAAAAPAVVAMVGYRTYPCGCLPEQVQDCRLAAQFLAQHYPTACQHVTVMGHSSGAHVALMMVVQDAIQNMMRHRAAPVPAAVVPSTAQFTIDAFVGLSGPYDISHHFDYEAARGVEELSPMKPVCGYTREAFRHNSPALHLHDALSDLHLYESSVDECLPRMALLHGMADDTVPFTSTAEAARVLRSCGVLRCQEIYLAQAGHEDTVMHMMLGGPTRDAVLEWMAVADDNSSKSQTGAILKASSKM